MSLDTRARRAADGVHASVTGVNPMTMLDDLKQTDQTRRRAGTAAAVVVLLLVVAGGAWYAAGARTLTTPPPTPAASGSPAPSLDQRQTVGSLLVPPVSARVPAQWSVDNDTDSLWLSGPKGMSIEVSKPITAALDPVKHKVIAAPKDYHAWLLQHPWVTVVSDEQVRVDGVPTYVTTYTLDPTLDPASTGLIDLVSDVPDFHGMTPGRTVIDVAIPVRHGTSGDPWAGGYRLLRHTVKAGGDGIIGGQEIDAGIQDFLASLRLPQ
ncbi:MAG: hypothetical protein U0Q21_16985 [Dermatophilaceae bacterium]